MKNQLIVAAQKLREAQEVFDYITKKVAHYDDIIEGRATDDTNPSARALTWKRCE